MSKIDLQKVLFKKTLNRMELMSCPEQEITRTVRIYVYRNHSFEPVASVIGSFLGYSGIQARFSYGSYDDSLSFSDIPDNLDLVLLWIDFDHYGKDFDVRSFLWDRLGFLRKKTKADILVVGVGGEAVFSENLGMSGCYVADTNVIRNQMGESFYDERFRKITATRLSNAACLEMARWLGMSLLPSIFQPNIKAIVLDLDNTLYAGVLGEDGTEGIILTEEHKRLQEELKKLKEKGFFLSLVSKNEIQDVQEMFRKRKDFPLTWEDFSAVEISWEKKASNILKIAERLRIAPDSMLFIDDNIGEISSVGSNLPDIRMILADSGDPSSTIHALMSFPGIFKWRTTKDDAKRLADLRSNEAREHLRQSLTQEEYIRQLDLRISYHVNDEKNLSRITELGGKTNQFIFSYLRLNEQEVLERMRRDFQDVVDFSLKDRLSDSGLIGTIITSFSDGVLVIEEAFVSCRALGREIEDVMLLKAMDIMRQKHASQEVRINYKKGERNQPARAWLQKITNQELKEDGYAVLPQDLFDIDSNHVTILVDNH